MTGAPASLGGRLLGGAALLVVLAVPLTALGMGIALQRFVGGQVDGRLDGQVAALAAALRPGPDGHPGLAVAIDGPPFDDPRSGWFWEVRAPGTVLRSRSLAQNGPPPGGTGEGVRARALLVRVGGAEVTVLAAAPNRAVSGPLREAMAPLLATLGLLAAALLGGVALQVRLGLRPLGALRDDLAAVRGGHLARIARPQPREVAPLVGELNTLLAENEANLERARRNVANLAHGLKTPLATLRLALAEPGRDAGGRLEKLVGTMDRLIRHHLARARAASLGGAARARLDLAPVLADHAGLFAKLYAEKGLAPILAVEQGATVACEGQDFDEIAGNLLDNACKWARKAVTVSARREGARVMLVVEDDGPGLGAAAAEMLRPGRRADEAVPGHGFGLPIAQELAELYGGTLLLGPSPLGGLRVAVDLPAAS